MRFAWIVKGADLNNRSDFAEYSGENDFIELGRKDWLLQHEGRQSARQALVVLATAVALTEFLDNGLQPVVKTQEHFLPDVLRYATVICLSDASSDTG